MTLRRLLLTLFLFGAAVAPASAQVIIPMRIGGFGGPWGGGFGGPWGSSFGGPWGGGFGSRSSSFGFSFGGSPGGVFSYVTPTYMTFPTTYTVGTQAMAPVGSPLAHDPRYQRWAGAYGYNVRPGMIVPHARDTLYPAVAVIGSGRPEQRVAQTTINDARRAQIELIVPCADAQVWFDGVATTQTGTVRQFITPPLEPGAEYSFDVRVSCPGAGGAARTFNHTIDIRAGQQRRIEVAVP